MKRAQTTGRSILPALLTVFLVLSLALLGWREWSNGNRHRERLVIEAGLREQLQEGARVLEESQALNATLRSTTEDQRITIQSLQDRSGNLEAQRDHLRTEAERLADKSRTMEAAVDALRAQLEAMHEELLTAQVRPQELAGQLKASEARNAALEVRLDEQAQLSSHMPGTMEISGLSTDHTVFSLSGDPGGPVELPASIFLCGTGGIYLDGWLHRREDGIYIGHIERWRTGTSTLVKGQKVFILPRKTYEADP